MTVGLFAKHWTPGATKTRLAASLGPEVAAALSRCFLETTLTRLQAVVADGRPALLALTPPESLGAFSCLPAVAQGGWRCVPQGTGTLGERMSAFFASSSPAVLVGSDSPHLPISAVSEAIEWLASRGGGRGIVLGPADDGGYWLIGVSGPPPVELFDALPWSSPQLLEETVARLDRHGWRFGQDLKLVEPWYDIDDLASLCRVRRTPLGDDAPLGRLYAEIDRLAPAARGGPESDDAC